MTTPVTPTSVTPTPAAEQTYDVTKQDHYTKHKIQPIEYIAANNLNFFEGCAIKYITRWRHKDGIKDLKKAIRNIEMMINAEETGDPFTSKSA